MPAEARKAWPETQRKDLKGNKMFTAHFQSESEVTQSCLTLCDPMDCSLPGSSVHGIFQARVLEWIAISFSRGIFPIQGSNPCLLHCRQMLYRLSHQGSPHTFKGSDIFLVIWKVNFTPRTRKDPSLFHLTDFKFLCKYEMKAQSITNCLGFEDVPSQHTGPLGKD